MNLVHFLPFGNIFLREEKVFRRLGNWECLARLFSGCTCRMEDWTPHRLHSACLSVSDFLSVHEFKTCERLCLDIPGVIPSQLPQTCCFISHGSWDCELSETAFQMSLLCPQSPVLYLEPADQEHPSLWGRTAAGYSPWEESGPELERHGPSHGASAGCFPNWGGRRVHPRCRRCSHQPRSVLWRCNQLCCMFAEKDQTFSY